MDERPGEFIVKTVNFPGIFIAEKSSDNFSLQNNEFNDFKNKKGKTKRQENMPDGTALNVVICSVSF